MTEPIFDIISKKRPLPIKPKEQHQHSYYNLLQNYLSFSYGYYSELFLTKICQQSQDENQKLRRFQLRKVLRQFVQKYMMSDLEIIYFRYFANLHEWNYMHPAIAQSVLSNEANNELNQINSFRLFLHLVCFFVKSYVGSKEEILALIDFHNQNLAGFSEIYHLWQTNNSEKSFQISPRDLNQLYSEYTRSCGQKTLKKDYNRMVDKILDLSTTYSIIPTKDKQLKSKKSSERVSKEVIPVFQKKNSLKNFDSHIWQQQNSFKMDFSDLRSHKKEPFALGSSILNENNEKTMEQKKEEGAGPRKISLNKKNKLLKDEVNNVTKSFFRGKDIGMSVEDMRKNENSLKDIVPSSFLDVNNHSSRIESLPLPYRNNSNLFGFSQMF